MAISSIHIEAGKMGFFGQQRVGAGRFIRGAGSRPLAEQPGVLHDSGQTQHSEAGSAAAEHVPPGPDGASEVWKFAGAARGQRERLLHGKDSRSC